MYGKILLDNAIKRLLKVTACVVFNLVLLFLFGVLPTANVNQVEYTTSGMENTVPSVRPTISFTAVLSSRFV